MIFQKKNILFSATTSPLFSAASPSDKIAQSTPDLGQTVSGDLNFDGTRDVTVRDADRKRLSVRGTQPIKAKPKARKL
ncbi:MAG: hypothetical protein GXO77_04640 [Calditrichaeota bacterium]|nr:hypothetical protein [Calditrichota bacterium]